MDGQIGQKQAKGFKRRLLDGLGYFLAILIFVGVKQYFERKQSIDSQKIVNTPEAIKVLTPQVTSDDKARFAEIQNILMGEMTSDEKESYLAVLDKMRTNNATKQDLINNGLMLQAVENRLPNEKKVIVQGFFNNMDRKVGDDMVKAYDK